ncbi:MAG: hypothetical protein PVJ60_09800 [Phycisphaerales bacterium]|jgi:hypothetical protein
MPTIKHGSGFSEHVLGEKSLRVKGSEDLIFELLEVVKKQKELIEQFNGMIDKLMPGFKAQAIAIPQKYLIEIKAERIKRNVHNTKRGEGK